MSSVLRWKRKKTRDPPETAGLPTPPHSGVNSSAASINSATHSIGSTPSNPTFSPMPLQRSLTESVVSQGGKPDSGRIKGLRRAPTWLTGTFSKPSIKSSASTSVSRDSISSNSARLDKPEPGRFPRRSSDTSSLQSRARSGSELSQIPENGGRDYFGEKRNDFLTVPVNEKPPASERRLSEPIRLMRTATSPITVGTRPDPNYRSVLDPNASLKAQTQPDAISDRKVEMVSEFMPSPEIKSEIRQEAQSEIKVEVKLEARPETRATSRSEAKLETMYEVDEIAPEVKTETKREIKMEVVPTTPSRRTSFTEVRSEHSPGIIGDPRLDIRLEAKAHVEPDVKVDLRSMPRTEVKVETPPRPPPTPRSRYDEDLDYGESDLAYPSTPPSSLFSSFWGTAQRTVGAAMDNTWSSSPQDTSSKDSEDGWERNYFPAPSQETEPRQQSASRPRSSAYDEDSALVSRGETPVQGQGSETLSQRLTDGVVVASVSQDPTSENYLQGNGTSTWTTLERTRRRPSIKRQPSIPHLGASTPTGQEESKLTALGNTQNLLLPSFSSTYRMKENPSILQQAARFLFGTEQTTTHTVFRTSDPPRIHKAVAIGVHGLFPAPYLRPMVSQPAGTSIRFASLGADAIRKWADRNGSPDCEIETIALEGDGKVNDRVDNLWKLLLNWADSIRSADLVLIACHSQAVPVSVILLDKLIDLGVITRNHVGVCAMAGVSLGPFAEYRSGIFSGSSAELWDFGNRNSPISNRFEASLKRVLDHGARITFVGAIDDQVVPLESAVYSPANHPNIYRAVFIDGRVHASDFISHLVGFALKLRNLGVSDHGLIRELSVPLAGSLYSGEGHSRLYYDTQVYDLAVAHALQTTSAAEETPCTITHHEGESNPYMLPWIMRGLLEENYVKTELSGETEEILRQFEAWKPTNKALKDVKYRLSAVRSKL